MWDGEEEDGGGAENRQRRDVHDYITSRRSVGWGSSGRTNQPKTISGASPRTQRMPSRWRANRQQTMADPPNETFLRLDFMSCSEIAQESASLRHFIRSTNLSTSLDRVHQHPLTMRHVSTSRPALCGQTPRPVLSDTHRLKARGSAPCQTSTPHSRHHCTSSMPSHGVGKIGGNYLRRLYAN